MKKYKADEILESFLKSGYDDFNLFFNDFLSEEGVMTASSIPKDSIPENPSYKKKKKK